MTPGALRILESKLSLELGAWTGRSCDSQAGLEVIWVCKGNLYQILLLQFRNEVEKGSVNLGSNIGSVLIIEKRVDMQHPTMSSNFVSYQNHRNLVKMRRPRPYVTSMSLDSMLFFNTVGYSNKYQCLTAIALGLLVFPQDFVGS